MHARVSYIEAQPDRVDAVVRAARDDALPTVRSQDGWKGFTVLVDRSSGRTVGISFWESEEAMRASEDAVEGSRRQAAEAGGGPEPRVHHFEVAIDETA